MKSHIVIPARLASTRLPEKLLLRETGKSLLQHTYEAAKQASLPNGVTVAVDHQRLLDEVQAFGGVAMMTDPLAQSGTDRIVEVARARPEIDLFINVQGDEPEISGEAIDQVARLLMDHPQADVATLATPLSQRADVEDPACVKVVCDVHGKALYFSRSVIPHDRSQVIDWESPAPSDLSQIFVSMKRPYLQHLGIYAYRREFLLGLHQLPVSSLEQLEKLEQLRFLQAGKTIVVGAVSSHPRGIDTPADYQAFVRRHQAG